MENRKYEINVDPRILELLGPSLYTNIYYVLAELIANAYDADASNVYIILNDRERIVVEDDGKGMSYKKGEVKKYLDVAAVSRNNDHGTFTKKGRKKMGRKGIGKLAALSVSNNVIIKTMTEDGEKSGFILTKNVPENHELEPIPMSEITFEKVKTKGTSITMNNPRYTLHKEIAVIKKNIARLFPLTDNEFKIHIIIDEKIETIEEFDKEIIKDLAAIIILGEEYTYLSEIFETQYDKEILCIKKPTYEVNIKTPELVQKYNQLEDSIWDEEKIEVEGWIGVYKSTRGRKSYPTDFPDNFLSLYANKKLGEFNILPIVGKNNLNEVYLVGQLHVDLFEKTELPDMALSNRQGYVSDDPRYQIVTEYVKNDLLPEILNLRKKYTDFKKSQSDKEAYERTIKKEEKLREDIDMFKSKITSNVTNRIKEKVTVNKEQGEEIEKLLNDELNNNFFDIGLKQEVDANKKKILISQTKADKDLSDIVYEMLSFNGVPKRDIIYSNSDDSESIIPILENQIDDIFDYLRTFFVESISTQNIYVVFITSHDLEGSWGGLVELGASWVTKSNYKIFNIKNFEPREPMRKNGMVWHNSYRDDSGTIYIDEEESELFIHQILEICRDLGYSTQDYENNKKELGRIVKLVNESEKETVIQNKFRKKPVVVEAYQTEVRKYIDTLEGRMKADIGDWIVTGIDGEQYPVKPDIFKQTYEKLD